MQAEAPASGGKLRDEAVVKIEETEVDTAAKHAVVYLSVVCPHREDFRDIVRQTELEGEESGLIHFAIYLLEIWHDVGLAVIKFEALDPVVMTIADGAQWALFTLEESEHNGSGVYAADEHLDIDGNAFARV